MLMFGLRLGTDPRVVVTATPGPTKLVRALLADPTAVVTRGSTYGTVPTWRLPSSIRSSANTRALASAARNSKPNSSTTCRVTLDPRYHRKGASA
jgi:phage terminase large subunit-like protein